MNSEKGFILPIFHSSQLQDQSIAMIYRIFLLCCLVFLFSDCQDRSATNTAQPPIAIIPQVQELNAGTGFFQIDNATKIVMASEGEAWQRVVSYLNDEISPALGAKLEVVSAASENRISFERNLSIVGEEAYELQVDPYEIIIRSKDARGAFYAVQSLLQLLAPEVLEKKPAASSHFRIPALKIKDAPRFVYRGMHLDVARHFFSVAEVKKYIDLLAFHKMNYFHWHLTEDQGWRIEIKKYPKLSTISAFRDGTLVGHYNDQPHQFDGKRYGGFYSQEEVRAIVKYAQDRFITIIPEIEMPGHSQAVLAAYPELACAPGPYEVWQKWGISDNVYCPTEATFTFLENVLTEVIDLFPGPYIHIGGDECPKRAWEESAFCQKLIRQKGLKDEAGLQSYFINRIEQFINTKGRQMIGWDEILEGGLAPNATVMSWRGVSGGIEAARSGHDVIMSPTTHCYFDYYQSDHVDEPLAIGGFIPLQKTYEYEPIPEGLDTAAAKHVLGAQGNVWTEYMPQFDQVEYMAFPRACAIAEL
ncbi:MAG: beta-N-acetylhexosaminidase, partial [Bacteroidota bacterium]